MKLLVRALGTSFFLGSIPIAPGTFGTLGGVAIAWALAGTELYLAWILATAAGLYALAVLVGVHYEALVGEKDPGSFVLDEVVGYLVVVAWAGPELIGGGPSLLTLFVAFVLFRFFDIAKPPPVKRLERVGGGHGIVLDDVMAGVYGFLTLLALRLLIPGETWVAASGPV